LAQLEHMYTIFQSENAILVERKNFQIFFYGEYKSFVLHHSHVYF